MTDHSRLLPGGPCSLEGSTVATNVLSHYRPLPDLPVISHNRLRNFRTYDRQVIHISRVTYGTSTTYG